VLNTRRGNRPYLLGGERSEEGPQAGRHAGRPWAAVRLGLGSVKHPLQAGGPGNQAPVHPKLFAPAEVLLIQCNHLFAQLHRNPP